MDITKCETHKMLMVAKANFDSTQTVLNTVSACAARLDSLLSTNKGFVYEGLVAYKQSVGLKTVSNLDYAGIRVISPGARDYFCACAGEKLRAHLRIGGPTNDWDVQTSALYMCLAYTHAQKISEVLQEIYDAHGNVVLLDTIRCCVTNAIY